MSERVSDIGSPAQGPPVRVGHTLRCWSSASERSSWTERRALAVIVIAMLFAHCAWTTPGVGVEMTIASDDAPGDVLDARGDAHVIEHASLRIASIALLRCPEERASLSSLLGPAIALAHEDETSALGPFVIDATDPTPIALGRLTILPGRYCDVRVRVAGDAEGPTLELRDDVMTIASDLERERVIRLATPITLDDHARTAHLALRVSLAGSLERVDPGAPDPIADGATVLSAILAALDIDSN
ncbi:hypothetical protein [Sandaracinus amylolyticus]|uniref:hypothetical protein n=1 Tax=Sandaracinus amylolyticus TaxID=927083 RepID=UPI001F317D6A|nr:hypothetical protein [Sandaracinus amylolyticus]UJR85318.1 Hypothetical protein I5071_73980 [Sandaracinus amylolyticus]